jgi:excinuclease ABC subunit A
MIKNADYIIDLGPEGGSGGGLLVSEGDPETVAGSWEKTGSFTGKYLAIELDRV